ncbi:MAG: glycine zipper 2TM domain-containing protein [Burkholderiaceae bacterium]
MELQMEINHTSNRIHPLMAGAAVSVMLVSLLGVAAIAGILPNSNGNADEAAHLAAAATLPVPTQQVANAPAVAKEVVEHKTVVHHKYVQHRATPTHARPVQIAQAEPVRQYSQAPAYQQPAPVAQNSPVGIGLGAVVGGLLGSQVGGGNGRTLAAIAGAVGGGYVGNEIAKRNY